MARKVKRAKVAKSTRAPRKAARGKIGAAADSAESAKATVDAVMPSTEALHRKFFGTEGADAVAPAAPTKMLGDNVKVVEMESGDLRKSVGVNEQTKKVEWSQG
jgi:hypothetical protein